MYYRYLDFKPATYQGAVNCLYFTVDIDPVQLTNLNFPSSILVYDKESGILYREQLTESGDQWNQTTINFDLDFC